LLSLYILFYPIHFTIVYLFRRERESYIGFARRIEFESGEGVELLRENNSYMVWRLNMPITNSRRNTNTSGVLVFLAKASSNGTTLFTREQLYLPGNDFVYLLQQNVVHQQ